VLIPAALFFNDNALDSFRTSSMLLIWTCCCSLRNTLNPHIFTLQIAWTMDARTRNHRDFNSPMVICKQNGLEYLWQSRKWVFSHAEIRGKDNKKNIESDLLPALQEVQVYILLQGWGSDAFDKIRVLRG
jgi:hypothetical protein